MDGGRAGDGRGRDWGGGAQGLNNGTHPDAGMHKWAHSAPWKKMLHKHFVLDAAIHFIALSVYYAQPHFLSGRICPVSLSGIDFFFFRRGMGR